jgi:hypothetical protein
VGVEGSALIILFGKEERRKRKEDLHDLFVKNGLPSHILGTDVKGWN